MMQVPSGLRSFRAVEQAQPVLSFTTKQQAGSLLYPQSNLLLSVALRICTIDERSKLTDVLVERCDAVKHDLKRLVRKSIFECEGVPGEYVTSIVGAPKQEIVII